MRLLIVSSDKYPPFRVDVKVLFAEELGSRGIEIDWILQSQNPSRTNEVERYGNGSVWVGPSAGGNNVFARTRRILQSVRHDTRVLSRARQQNYDFIITKDKFIGAIFALIAARISKTKFVYWLSFPFPEAQIYTARNGFARFPIVNLIRGCIFDILLYRLILPSCTFAFVQSNQMKKDLVARGIHPDKLTPVPMGITQELLDTAPDVPLADAPTVAYLGTMVPVRHLEFVLRTFRLILKKCPEARLLMIGGDQSDIERLKQEATRIDIDQAVKFTGNLKQAEALRLVASAHVCISPFYPTPILNSTSPTKLIEYMALGKAVVANHHPEQSTVIEQSEGGLCVDWQEQSFAEATSRLLLDLKLAYDMGQRGRQYAETRSYKLIANVVEAELTRRHQIGAH